MANQVDNYILQVAAQLGKMSAQRRNDELAELRRHLENAVKGYITNGMADTEAQAEAIRQFGTANEVASGLRSAWRRELRIAIGANGILGAAAFGALLYAPSVIGPITERIYPVIYQIHNHVPYILSRGAHAGQVGSRALMLSLGSYLALTAILITIAPKRARWGTLTGATAYIAFMRCFNVPDFVGSTDAVYSLNSSNVVMLCLIVVLLTALLRFAVNRRKNRHNLQLA